MIHPEWKQEYINYCVSMGAGISAKKRIALLFKRISGIEGECGTDICMMDAEHASAILKSPGVLSVNVFYASVCILRDYVNWCAVRERTSPEAHALFVVPEGLEPVRRTMVSGPEHLELVLNLILDAVSSETVDSILRLYAWMLFAAMHPEDIQNIRVSDVDLDRMSVRANQKEYVLHKLAAPALEFAVYGDRFRISHPQFSSKPRDGSDFLMRGTKGVLEWHDCSSRMTRKFAEARRAGKCSLAPTFLSIGKSGMFYEIYREELSGSYPDFTVDIEEYMTYKTERRKKNYSVNGKDATEIHRRALMTSFLEDYSRWKLAFLPSLQ